MSTRHINDGLYKRCDCSHRAWLKCAHPWHFDFYCRRTAARYRGKAKHRYSLAKLSGETGFMSKERAKALRDDYRSQIRGGTFSDPTAEQLPALPVSPDGRLTLNDVLDGYVFGNEVGEPVKSVRTAWRATCRRAHIHDLHLHDLRREFGSRLLESGAPLMVARDFLGHADISQTSTYLATTAQSLEDALSRMERHQDRAQQAEREHRKSSHTATECDNPTVLSGDPDEDQEVQER